MSFLNFDMLIGAMTQIEPISMREIQLEIERKKMLAKRVLFETESLHDIDDVDTTELIDLLENLDVYLGEKPDFYERREVCFKRFYYSSSRLFTRNQRLL